MNILFERATTEDAQKLIEVQNRSFNTDLLEYGECPACNLSEDHMKNTIKNAIVYKIIYDNNIVGDIIIRKLGNNNYYLGGICVLPECQNLGIGQKAIKHIESDNPDAVSWELITPFNRYRNHHFYEKMGYIKIEETVHSEKLTLFKYRKEV